MITLYLAGRVRPGDRPRLEAFLAEATPFYEAPGGIRVRLQWDRAEPERFLEIMEYADAAAHDADQRRVDEDPTMREYLRRWHEILDGPVEVTAYDEE
ncbi:hypothetical protein AGMMS50218_05470 [Actinomycetota bacterium]|nr:hypothetical protein AGMMS50218_05470 [Actinomycetota bacterium]